MSGHTPGPWTVPYKEFSKVKAENGAVIATCHKLTNLTNLEANARLLAAAPDLLSVCQRLATVNVFSADNDVAQNIMMACDAVEKATGEKA